MRSQRFLLAPVLVILVATSACSDTGNDTAGAVRSAGAGASSSIPNPCALVAAEQLVPLVGATPVTTGPTEQFRGTTCHWETSTATGASLDLTVWPGREFFSATPGSTPVAGLGDEAESDGAPLARVIWRQGDVTAQLVGLGMGDGGTDKVVALARAVADRLSPN
jgi:hypothetical protein